MRTCAQEPSHLKNTLRKLFLVSVLLVANAAFANAAGPGGTDPVPPPPGSSATAIITQAINVLQSILSL